MSVLCDEIILRILIFGTVARSDLSIHYYVSWIIGLVFRSFVFTPTFVNTFLTEWLLSCVR
jgi:hypothetical protein